MAIPDFQSMMLPFLKIIDDGKSHKIKAIINGIAEHFQCTQEDREERLPSGKQFRLNNRVGWARTHLKYALLIEYVNRGVVRITQRGLDLLSTNPSTLSVRDLMAFPEYKEWSRGGGKDDPKPVPDKSPQETIADLTELLDIQLANDLLKIVSKMDPYQFEQLVVDLLVAMGYGGSREEAAKVTQGANDEGIDGIIKEDRLGLDVIYVQAKRWQANIGRKEIQAFVGALAGKQANKGVFITTSAFGKNATEYANAVSQKIILVDGILLGKLMIEFNIGVSKADEFIIKRIDTDYFESE